MGLDLTGSSLLWVLVLFTAGLVCIIKGGDFFVDAAAWMAEASGIPKFIIGCTVVSFATTLPEMLVSVFAALEGNADIAVGNAVGSVTANTGLILCLSLVCMTCAMQRKQFGMKACLLLAAVLALFAFTRDSKLSVLESVLILLIFAVSLTESLLSARREQGSELSESEERPEVNKKTIALNIGKFILGAAAIVLGAQLLIDNGSALAGMVGVPDAVIAATMIAARTGHDHHGHPQEAVYTFRGQHHRRKHHGSDGDSAAVRPDSGPPAERGKPGYAAGYSRLSHHQRRGADSRADQRPLQALDGLFGGRIVRRLPRGHVRVLRCVTAKKGCFLTDESGGSLFCFPGKNQM